jgi:hypothetical protein
MSKARAEASASSMAAENTEEQDSLALKRKPYLKIGDAELQAAYRKACRDSVEMHDRVAGMRAELVARQAIAAKKAELEKLQAENDALVGKLS